MNRDKAGEKGFTKPSSTPEVKHHLHIVDMLQLDIVAVQIEARNALVFPGQGSFPKSLWAEAPENGQIIDTVQSIAPPGTDIKYLFKNIREERNLNSFNTHLLLATVMAVVSSRIRDIRKGQSYVVTGHSAGLSNCLGLTGFFTDGTKGLVETMMERGKLLDEAQKTSPGKMFAVEWKGKDGFAELAGWVLEKRDARQESVWAACFNLENDESAQVVLTARDGLEIETELRERFKDRITKITKLNIGVGAHSKLVGDSPQKYKDYLTGLQRSGKIKSFTDSGVVYVSDHIMPGNATPLASQDKGEIIEDISRFDLPVEFQRTVRFLADEMKIKRFIEIGSETLSPFIRKMGYDAIAIKIPLDLEKLETPDF